MRDASSFRAFVFVIGTSMLAAGCGFDPSAPIGQSPLPAIYGADDRREAFEETDTRFRELLEGATIVSINPSFLDERNPDDIQMDAPTQQEAYGTCNGVRFNEQPAGGFCSATLIDDDLVLTAGHCAFDLDDCQSNKWVFNYYYRAAGQLQTITSEDVFDCQRVIVRRLDETRFTAFDYAIIQLDRAATPRHRVAPVTSNRGALATGAGLHLLSYPAGIPGKSGTGRVIDPRELSDGFFEMTIDSFEGSSGGALYNDDGEIVGIAVRGAPDFETQGSCDVPSQLADDGRDDIEEGTYVRHAIDALCASGHSSPRLCGGGADGGTTSTDGGTTRPDGGTTTRPDGGSTSADGGTTPGADGGTAGRSSGGCAAAPLGAPADAWWIVLAASWFASRRRRRSR
jgi:V8-like Glu-specific endopeptidase